jgi:hypothetical protein
MQYVYEKPGGGVARPQDLGDVLVVARARIETGDGPFKALLDGAVMFDDADRAKALRRTKAIAGNLKVGETLRVRREGESEVAFWLRAVADDVETIDISGNDHADEFWTWVVTEFGAYKPRFAGAYVCKSISGSGGVASQHSYGNAVDVFFDTFAHQTAVYNAVKRGDCPVPIANAISGRTIWQPGDGEDPYGGDPHWHLHCDFLPAYGGGCGVRG